jgi:hypothetical protein
MLIYQDFIFSLKKELRMNKFLKSLLFFITHIFSRREYDVVFYYPSHFNRGNENKNLFFSPYYKACDSNNLKYIIFEEPCFGASINKDSIPIDFIFYIIQILRKIIPISNGIKRDNFIGAFIGRTILRFLRFKNVIVISKSMLSFFKGINPNARIFDVQHGIIYENKSDYFIDNTVSEHLEKNDIFLLLFGNRFLDILKKKDLTKYFEMHAFVIGGNIVGTTNLHQKFNNNILISLQFTHDHTASENAILLEELNDFITSSRKGINFYLKNHPRFNNEVNLSEIFKLPNVIVAPSDINECFSLCSLHATAYSTSTFEAALLGIPTILIPSENEFNFFQKEFNYPLNNSIDEFSAISFYQEKSNIIKGWATAYYTPFNESKFLNLLR